MGCQVEQIHTTSEYTLGLPDLAPQANHKQLPVVKQLTEYCQVAHAPQAHVCADNGGRHRVDAVACSPDGMLPVIPQLVPVR